MKAFITIYDNEIVIMARAESSDDENAMIGDMMLSIHPGEDFEGLSYDELRAHGDGEIEIP